MAKKADKKQIERLKEKAVATAGTDHGSRTGARKSGAETAAEKGQFSALDKERPRRVAEELLISRKGQSRAEEVITKEMAEKDLERFIHEMQTYQAELEIQNEELRDAQLKVEESRSRYAELYEFAPVGYFTLDKNGSVLEANLTGAQMLGVDRSGLVKGPFTRYIHDADRGIFRSHVRIVLGSAERQACELRIRKGDGSVFYALLESIRSAGTGKDTYLTTLIDITDRKQAEAAVGESEERFRAIFEGNTDGMLIVDPQSKAFVMGNQAICRMLGCRPEEIPTMRLADIHRQEDLPSVLDHFESHASGRVSIAKEIPVKRKDGSVFFADITSNPITLSGKTCFVRSFRDITERKLAEEALKKSRAELEERVKERTRELADSQKQLRNLYTHLQSLREEERINVAREIRDDLGQALTALKMDLSWIAGKLLGSNKGFKEQLNADVDEVDKTIDAVERLCTELRPGILDHFGLAAAIEWQVGEFQKRTGIKCEVVFDPANVEVDPDLKTALFRIFQKTLTNRRMSLPSLLWCRGRKQGC
jgi:PAS domain S-box-containing protein